MAPIPQNLIPAQETKRLEAIRQYDVAKSLQEAVFSEFVVLTARIFSLPISLIALVDETQVWYKANVGLPSVKSQPREEALCSTAILEDKVVVYADLATEQSPLITPEAASAAHNKELRFYAAAPICMPDKSRIGSLCVIDRQPRSFSPDEQSLLNQIASLVSHMVAVRHCFLCTPGLGEYHWIALRQQIQEELQELAALVRYLLYRHGTHVPVATDVVGLISRRLNDLREVLDQQES